MVEKNSHVIPVTAQTAVDEETLRIARPYHEMAEKYLKTVVARSNASLDAKLGRVEDSALMDAIQTVQLFYAKADVSFASLFNTARDCSQRTGDGAADRIALPL